MFYLFSFGLVGLMLLVSFIILVIFSFNSKTQKQASLSLTTGNSHLLVPAISPSEISLNDFSSFGTGQTVFSNQGPFAVNAASNSIIVTAPISNVKITAQFQINNTTTKIFPSIFTFTVTMPDGSILPVTTCNSFALIPASNLSPVNSIFAQFPSLPTGSQIHLYLCVLGTFVLLDLVAAQMNLSIFAS
jgi:hypothetical protein